jgi:Sap, sulfolipid-1-addressing protein
MGQAIGEVIPFAIGIAITPVSIIAVILMLFSPRARVNGLSFLVGWVVGLAVVSGVVYAIANGGDVSSDKTASDTSYWIKVALGVLLVLLTVRHWRHRPAAGDEAATPK